MKTSEKTDKIYAALLSIKKELTSVSKSSDNPFFKSKYADLNTHLEAVEPLAEKNGCIVLQPINENNTVETRIIEVQSQQFVSSEMPLIVAKNNMQDAGSAITYARRYTLGALLSMKAEDDDGNITSGNVKPKYTAPAKQATPTPAAVNTNSVAAAGAATVATATSAPTTTAQATTTPKGLKPSTFRNKAQGATAHAQQSTPVVAQPEAKTEESQWQ